jgi:hypothetical protein
LPDPVLRLVRQNPLLRVQAQVGVKEVVVEDVIAAKEGERIAEATPLAQRIAISSSVPVQRAPVSARTAGASGTRARPRQRAKVGAGRSLATQSPSERVDAGERAFPDAMRW